MKSIFSEENESVIGYMCGTDFQYELGAASGGNRIYPSVENLKEHQKCWEECGIVEVKVTLNKVVVEEDFSKYFNKPNEETNE